MCSRCFAGRCQTELLAASSTASPTDLLKSLPKRASSRRPENGQRLAGNVAYSEKSYKRECQEKYLPFGSVPKLFLSRAFSPTCLNVPSRFESGLPRAESLISFRRVTRRNVSSSLWFHTLVATAPFVSETSSLTVIHFMSCNSWSYR